MPSLAAVNADRRKRLADAVERAKYDGIDFTPPAGAREEARKGLEWRREFGRGGTPVGWARARDIANGDQLSPDTIGRMVSFFARHEGNKQADGWSPGEQGYPSNGRIAWALWGGDAGKSWSAKVKRQMESIDNVERSSLSSTVQREDRWVTTEQDNRLFIEGEELKTSPGGKSIYDKQPQPDKQKSKSDKPKQSSSETPKSKAGISASDLTLESVKSPLGWNEYVVHPKLKVFGEVSKAKAEKFMKKAKAFLGKADISPSEFLNMDRNDQILWGYLHEPGFAESTIEERNKKLRDLQDDFAAIKTKEMNTSKFTGKPKTLFEQWADSAEEWAKSKHTSRSSEVEKIHRQFGIVKDGKAVIATETPIEIYDQQRGWIKQVLLMDGAVFRNGKKQLPIVDSHNDKTVRNVFGSIRGITIEDGQMIGSAEFATDDESQVVATRYAEGHLNDFSIDAVILERQLVPQGQSYTTSRGEVIEGPAEIVTKWEPHNASICATGADPNSTVRRSSDRERVTRMDESLMAKLRTLGLPEGMTDAGEIIAWMAEKMPEASIEIENMAGEDKKPEDMAERAENYDEKDKVEKMEDEVKAEVERQLKAEKVRRSTILNHCKLANLERSFADELVEDESVTVEIAQERIIRKMASQPLGGAVGSDVRVTESEQDKFEAAASAGLIQRCFQGGGIKRSKPEQVQGQDHFANLGLYRLAEACVRRMGINPDRYNKSDVARMAMGHQPTFDRLRVQRSAEAYHTTGTFANLLLDAANKTLRAAYDEAPYTWSLWARQAASVTDFKNINRIQIGESPNLEMVPETKPYPEKAVGDSKRTYKIEKYGAEFTVSWETVINDDLDALSRIPAMQGAAARRTQEKAVYDALLSNPLMPDGFALFSASHPSGTNVTATTAAAPGVTTLNEAFELMGKQKGLASDVFLNLAPRTLLVPLRYSATALELVNSQSYAASNNNSGVVNIYGVNGVRPLQVVTTPLLDANSATNWYAIADNSQIDTVEITFLSGEESPVLENEWIMSSDVYRYKVRQSFAAAVIDHRGIFGNR